MTIAGVVGAVCVGALIYLALTVTALGITSPGSRIAIAAAFVSGVAVYAGEPSLPAIARGGHIARLSLRPAGVTAPGCATADRKPI